MRDARNTFSDLIVATGRYTSEHRRNALRNVLHRPVESATQSGHCTNPQDFGSILGKGLPMDSERLNSYLTVLANFGVVIGLAVLIYELRESQNLAETEAAVRRLDQMQLAQVEMATSDTLSEIKVKANLEGIRALSDVERYRLRSWEFSVMLRMRSQYTEYIRGYLDEDTANGIVIVAAESLPLWEELGFNLGDNEFIRAVRDATGR